MKKKGEVRSLPGVHHLISVTLAAVAAVLKFRSNDFNTKTEV